MTIPKVSAPIIGMAMALIPPIMVLVALPQSSPQKHTPIKASFTECRLIEYYTATCDFFVDRHEDPSFVLTDCDHAGPKLICARMAAKI